MRSNRRKGAGKGEIIGFICVMSIAGIFCLFYFQKPKVVEHTVYIEPTAPPAPAVVAPPPAPIVVEAPSLPVETPIVKVAVAPPPPVPECLIIEGKVRDAQTALAKVQAELTESRKAALAAVRLSSDYTSDMSDLADEQKNRQSAMDQLAKDNSVNADTDHDDAAIKAAAQAIIAIKAKIKSLQNDAVASDATVVSQEEALKTAQAKIASLQKRLGDYIAGEILNKCGTDNCALESVTMDVHTGAIEVKIIPDSQTNPGAGPDAAMNQIGSILDKVLCKAQFSWSAVGFTVYADLHKKQVPEFQTVYLRNAIDDTTFTKKDGKHYDVDQFISLAHSTWLSQAVSEIQGIPATSPVIIPAMGVGTKQMVKYTDSLLIGGYSRSDGTSSPPTYLRVSYSEELHPAASAHNGSARVVYFPPFSTDNPLIVPMR